MILQIIEQIISALSLLLLFLFLFPNILSRPWVVEVSELASKTSRICPAVWYIVSVAGFYVIKFKVGENTSTL